MSSIVSLIMCFALLFTGGTPEATTGRSFVIHDVVLALDDTEYALTPEASFSVQTNDDTVLFDLGVLLNDEILFPIQAKVSEDGIQVLPGNSGTVYTFAPEAFDAVIDEGTAAVLQAMAELFTAVPSLKSIDEGTKQEANQYILDKFVIEEQGEGTIEMEDLDANMITEIGTVWTASLSNDQFVEIMDYYYLTLLPEVGRPYFKLMNAMLAIDNVYTPQFNSFSDLMSSEGVKMELNVYGITNETCGILDYELNVTAQETSLIIPFTAEIYNESDSFVYGEIASDSGELSFSAIQSGEAVDATITLNADALSYGYNIVTDQATTFSINGFCDTGIGYTLFFVQSITGLDTETPSGHCDYSVAGEKELGLIFDYDLQPATVEDRIDNVPENVIEAFEDTGDSGIALAFTNMLMADLGKLQADPSVANTIANVSRFMEDGFQPTSSGGDDFMFEEEQAVSGSIEGLSFTVPTYNGLPEGYALAKGYYYPEYDIAYQIYSLNGDAETEEGLIYVNTSPAANYGYSLDLDGHRTEGIEPVIRVERMEEYMNASFTKEGLDIFLSIDGDWMTDEQLATFFSNIEF